MSHSGFWPVCVLQNVDRFLRYLTLTFKLKLYRVSNETSAKLRVVIHWLILSEKCCINMGRNINRFIVMGGKRGSWKAQSKWNILTEEMNQLLRNCILLMFNVRCEVSTYLGGLLFEMSFSIGSANAQSNSYKWLIVVFLILSWKQFIVDSETW
jgi:hypothetical protein